MRNIDRNQRNSGTGNDVRNRGSHVLLDLKLDDQIDGLGNKFIRVPDCRIPSYRLSRTTSSIPEEDAAARRLLVTASENGISALWPAKPKRIFLGREHQPISTILCLCHVTAMNKGFEYPVNAGLRNRGALIDQLKRERILLRFEQLQNVERLGKNRDQ